MDVTQFVDSLPFMAPWAVYVAIALGPFVQEDLAVITAAGLCVTGQTELIPTLLAIFIGLFLSDAWKYWIGWAALNNKKGRALSEKEKVLNLKDKVLSFPFSTLIAARFVPLTRIPAYVACGFFQVSYVKYCLYIAITAVMYITLLFSAFHLLGELMAEQLKWVFPIIGLSFAAIIVGLHLRARKTKQ